VREYDRACTEGAGLGRDIEAEIHIVAALRAQFRKGAGIERHQRQEAGRNGVGSPPRAKMAVSGAVCSAKQARRRHFFAARIGAMPIVAA
jgi:hypothetical protein